MAGKENPEPEILQSAGLYRTTTPLQMIKSYPSEQTKGDSTLRRSVMSILCHGAVPLQLLYSFLFPPMVHIHGFR
jgi:hypothetical protein